MTDILDEGYHLRRIEWVPNIYNYQPKLHIRGRERKRALPTHIVSSNYINFQKGVIENVREQADRK